MAWNSPWGGNPFGKISEALRDYLNNVWIVVVPFSLGLIGLLASFIVRAGLELPTSLSTLFGGGPSLATLSVIGLLSSLAYFLFLSFSISLTTVISARTVSGLTAGLDYSLREVTSNRTLVHLLVGALLFTLEGLIPLAGLNGLIMVITAFYLYIVITEDSFRRHAGLGYTVERSGLLFNREPVSVLALLVLSALSLIPILGSLFVPFASFLSVILVRE